METEENPQQLTTDLSKAADFIKDVLTLANGQQKSLKEKARIVKNQIQDDISFHLELLRNREVWLLEQVDILAQLKEESIESNQNDLRALVTKLEVYLEIMQTTKFGQNPEVAVQVGNVLSTIHNESFNADESADISFIVNNFALSDAIKNFGSIVEGISDAACRKSASAGQRKSQSTNQSKAQDLLFVREHFKSVLSSPASDWLIVPLSSSMDEYALRETSGLIDGVEEFYNELKQSDAKEWLYEEGQPIDLETITNGFTLHFQEIKEAPLTDWVQSGVVVDTSNEPTTSVPFDTSEGLDTWLLTPEALSQAFGERNAMNECAEQESHDMSSEVGKMDEDNAVENEWLLTAQNAVEYRLSPDPMKLEENSNPEDWLLPCQKTRSSGEQVTEDENWLQRFRESMGKSTSDWLIVSGGEPEYCQWLTRESIDRCKNCPGECARDTFKVFRNVLNSSRSEWLATAKDW